MRWPMNRHTWPAAPGDEAFHGLAGDFVRAIAPHSEADPIALLGQLLVAFGNAIGRKPHFMAEDDRHGMNLYLLLVGESSKGRKGISWGRTKRLVQKADPSWDGRIQTGLSSGEGLIWAVRDPITQHGEIVDEGVPDKRLLVVESEFASVLKMTRREGNVLSPIMRAAWDDGTLSTLVKTNPAKSTDAHISIIGHITRPELLRCLGETETANGFANRFIFLAARRSKFLPEGGHPDPAAIQELEKRLTDALAFAKDAGHITRNAQAAELWSQLYPKLSAGQDGMLGSVTGRAEAQVMRLASLYALLDQSMLIYPIHLRAATELWQYAYSSCTYLFGDSLGDLVADRILSALRQFPDGLTKTEILNIFSRHESKRVDRALAYLEEVGLIRPIRETTGGRPSIRYVAIATEATKLGLSSHMSQPPDDKLINPEEGNQNA